MDTKTCRYDGCTLGARGLGYCPGHYRQHSKGQPLRPLAPRQRNKGLTCAGPDCTRPAYSRGLCASHHDQLGRGRELTPLGSAPRGRARIYGDVACSFHECGRLAVAKGLCSSHNAQRRKGQELRSLGHRPPRPRPPCAVAECEKLADKLGYCTMHYGRLRRTGSVDTTRRFRGGPVQERFTDESGYIHLLRPGHPEARKGGRWGYEHRIVMSDTLGRPLRKGENVHHINGDRSDNRPENLELWDRSQVPGQRVADRIKWMVEYLAQYGMAVVPAKREMPVAD